MGKRAKKAAPASRKKDVLAKRFKCPFCANEDVVECKMDLPRGVGSLACRICSASYQMPIHHLHEAIDVFSEWLDDCEAAERGDQGGVGAQQSEDARQGEGEEGEAVHDTGADYDDDSEEELPEASGLGQKKGREDEGKRGAAGSGLGLDDSEEDSD